MLQTTKYRMNIAPTSALPKYSFNAKELDEETGMYYYEARYYNPPVFTSRDPMFEKYFWMSPPSRQQAAQRTSSTTTPTISVPPPS